MPSDDDAPDGGAPPSGAGPALYANRFEVGYNAFEFLLDFGQHYADEAHAPGGIQTRIVTAPAYAKLFLALLGRSVAEYEAHFGAIVTDEDGLRAAPPPAEGSGG